MAIHEGQQLALSEVLWWLREVLTQGNVLQSQRLSLAKQWVKIWNAAASEILLTWVGPAALSPKTSPPLAIFE